MKKSVDTNEMMDLMEDLFPFTGQKITLFCLNYIYTGTLVGFNDRFVKLGKAAIVYETGAFDKPGSYQDAQSLPNDLYIKLDTVESFTVLK